MTINLKSWADKRIPPVRSSLWPDLVSPLFDYLSEPRTIDEILEWGAIRGHSTSRVNNMLAYLSFTGKVRHDGLTSRWMHGSDCQSYLESWRDCRGVRMEQQG
jgi:hypothetical protein